MYIFSKVCKANQKLMQNYEFGLSWQVDRNTIALKCQTGKQYAMGRYIRTIALLVALLLDKIMTKKPTKKRPALDGFEDKPFENTKA